jgi:hypothetical protein
MELLSTAPSSLVECLASSPYDEYRQHGSCIKGSLPGLTSWLSGSLRIVVCVLVVAGVFKSRSSRAGLELSAVLRHV